ncbi:hypothetical protein CBR_g31310 [Chara braunii]|uniref:Uncharacterized protein n=1 Tax=Chara braunii TaxID=69332 RepID=A0A388LEL8_CHABU|nr:hypothetical protein CBR_g31310 [Chara braunii]|eukprot:GBG80755.1 hypothetical protein CBR_g31310 [Chara braunii]
MDVFSRMQARGRRQQEEECRRMVAEAEEELANEPVAELYWQCRRNKWLQRLEDLQMEQQVVWAKRAQEKGVRTTDRLTKETFQRLCPPRQHSLMRELQHLFHAEAPLATDSTTIGEYAFTHFKDILTSRRQPDISLQQLREEQEMWRHTHTQLGQEAADALEQPFTAEELQQAVQCMARGKSPGSDGLPVHFYEATWEHIGPDLLKLYNRVPDGDILTEDMKLGIITLIYKKDDKSNIWNWRPISRLNVSYKILAKALSRRLAPYLPKLVHTDQGAFIQGRSSEENILMVVGALKILDSQGRPFAASTATGNFGRRWVERGVVKLADLWCIEEGDWKTEQQLRTRLGGLQLVQVRSQQIQAAIPPEWKQLLQAPKLLVGKWYRSEQPVDLTAVYYVTQQLDEDTWQAQAWTPQQELMGTNELQLLGEVALDGRQELQQIRVYRFTKQGVTCCELLLNGLPLRNLRIDPLAWSWETQSGIRRFLQRSTRRR